MTNTSTARVFFQVWSPHASEYQIAYPHLPQSDIGQEIKTKNTQETKTEENAKNWGECICNRSKQANNTCVTVSNKLGGFLEDFND